MSRPVLLGVVVAIVVAVVASSWWLFLRESNLPSGAPAIHGTITNATASANGGVILVEENPNDRSGTAKASVTVTGSTRILLRRASGYTTGRLVDLGAGRLVDVWFDGLVMTSYPLQARARVVVVRFD